MLNKGINIRPAASPEVVASRRGRVVFCADNFESYGSTIIIDHGDGFLTIYAGNLVMLIKAGDSVQRGMSIARIRTQDVNNYLHFEIRKGYVPQNPYFYLSR